jgi:hypothetical protein
VEFAIKDMDHVAETSNCRPVICGAYFRRKKRIVVDEIRITNFDETNDELR